MSGEPFGPRPQDEPPRLLADPCLACNREAGAPMCALCDAMTRAEEEAEQGHAGVRR